MWRKANPIFSAKVSLLVETPKGTTTSSAAQLPFETYVAMLQSDDFNRYVNSTFTAQELALIRRGFEPLQQLPSVDGRAVSPAHLTITADQSSGKIFIKIRSAEPEAAALVANRWALRLIDYSLDRSELQKKALPDLGVARVGVGMQNTSIAILDPAYIPTRADNVWW